MKRQITVEMDLTNEQLSRIVPSGYVWVEITAVNGAVENQAEIVKVVDLDE